MSERCEALVIGTGFGGAISACRLGRRWPGKVVVLERGKRYGLGDFPRSPGDFARNFWVLPDHTPHPHHIRKAARRRGELHGLFDVRNYDQMDVVVSAGVGGGSLIYANVFLLPPDQVFSEGWPEGCRRSDLLPYYEVAKSVLGARPIPSADSDPRRRVPKTELFQRVAREAHRPSELLDINVFFGKDLDGPPLPLGQQERNRYGALQTSCTYCGECVVGCNQHAKNTVDLNYLYAAEHFHQVQLRSECMATEIVPLDASGTDCPTADGSHGYRITYRDLGHKRDGSILAQRVVVSAGCLGTTELLLRCKKPLGTLPGISDRLGMQFSGNGDFLSFVLDGFEGHPTYGPTITQKIDYHLFQEFLPKQAFILEDASYPAFLAWFVEGVRPRWLWLRPFMRLGRHLLTSLLTGKSPGQQGYALTDLLSNSTTDQSAVLLCMGLDEANGVMGLDDHGQLTLHWPRRSSQALYDAILAAGEEFKRRSGAKLFLPLPTWDWPLRNNITVHPLGGCVLADSQTHGVVSAEKAHFGEVFGYRGLYVADGSLLPTASGANPVATISALSEIVAEGITQLRPDSTLR